MIEGGGFRACLGKFGADEYGGSPSATVRIVAGRLVEHDDQHAIVLEWGAGQKRRDIGLQPRVGDAQRAIMSIVAKIRRDE